MVDVEDEFEDEDELNEEEKTPEILEQSSNKLWESRKANVVKLYNNINRELELIDWIFIDPSNLKEKINLSEFIEKMRDKMGDYLMEEVARESVDMIVHIVRRVSDVLRPRVLEPFRQSLQLFKEFEIKMNELNSTNRNLLMEIESLKKQILDYQTKPKEIVVEKDLGEAILPQGKVEIIPTGVVVQQDPNSIVQYKLKFIAEKIKAKNKVFDSKKSISYFIRAYLMQVKRSKKDLWRVNALNEIKNDLIKEHGYGV